MVHKLLYLICVLYLGVQMSLCLVFELSIESKLVFRLSVRELIFPEPVDSGLQMTRSTLTDILYAWGKHKRINNRIRTEFATYLYRYESNTCIPFTLCIGFISYMLNVNILPLMNRFNVQWTAFIKCFSSLFTAQSALQNMWAITHTLKSWHVSHITLI